MNQTGIQTTPDTKARDFEIPAGPPMRLDPDTLWAKICYVLKPLASLRLTVVLFALSMFVVFCGTLAQVESGLGTAVEQYFRSAFVWIPFQLFVKFSQVFFGLSEKAHVGGSFPFPGGWLLGGLLLANLLAAHLVRFKISWKRSGILLIHSGLVIMMVSELVTGLFAIESRMTLNELETSNYLDVHDETELAITDPSDPAADHVVVIPDAKLKKGGVIRDDKLPFDVEVLKYMPNSSLVDAHRAPRDKGPTFTSAVGSDFKILEQKEETGVAADKSDVPSVRVRFLKKGTTEVLDQDEYFLSLWFYPNTTSRLPNYKFPPQTLDTDDKSYTVELRPRRIYKDYSIRLIKFHHDVYPGTTTPRNYASDIELIDPKRNEKREITISMNDPLRHDGETFYQSGVLPGSKGTILQVVRNPGWLMPYISCGVVSLGMVVHFGLLLIGFLNVKLARQPVLAPVPTKKQLQPEESVLNWSLVVPSVVLGVFTLIVLLKMTSPGPKKGETSLADIASLPVVADGRIKPLDTLAIQHMTIISKKQSFKDKADESQPALIWLLDVLSSDPRSPLGSSSADHKVFRIDNIEVVDFLKLERRPGSWRYSLKEIGANYARFETEARRADEVESKKRNLFDQKILELSHNLQIYLKLAQGHEPRIIPVGTGEADWLTFGEIRQECRAQALRVILSHDDGKKLDKEKQLELVEKSWRLVMAQNYPAADAWARMLDAYRANKFVEMTKAATEFRQLQGRLPESASGTAKFEVFFNNFSPFHLTFGFYFLVFVLSCLAWIAYPHVFIRTAVWLAFLTLAVHTFALLARMYIQGRPPVTNLYSSAVFIGWGCVVMGLFIERIFRNGIGVAMAASLGAATSLVANYLSESKGDTLEMMQAVLDTNFWLATHVTCITLGYSATFFAGFLGMMFILLGVFTNRLDQNTFRSLGQMIYGVLCFATLLSFVGTVLGGIWADQSWGRFWGWDPKENGALLIVLINALILHARWAGLIKQRGLATLTLVGNMVTGWSWFGTNQLGVGLHAYGFNNTLALGLTIFWISQVIFIGLGMIPAARWSSFGQPKTVVSAR